MKRETGERKRIEIMGEDGKGEGGPGVAVKREVGKGKERNK